jgi:chaperonin GroES
MTNLKISQLKPLAGYVLVEPAEVETETKSGIILPGNEDEKPQYGTVLAVGEGCGCDSQSACACKDDCSCEAPVEKGQMVVYKEWGGNKVSVDDKEYQFLKFEDILAIINKK